MKRFKKLMFVLPVVFLVSAVAAFALNGTSVNLNKSKVEYSDYNKCDDCGKENCKGNCTASSDKAKCSKEDKAKCSKGKKACCAGKKGDKSKAKMDKSKSSSKMKDNS